MRKTALCQIVCSPVPEIGGPFRVMEAISKRFASDLVSSEFDFTQVTFGESRQNLNTEMAVERYSTFLKNKYGFSFSLFSKPFKNRVAQSDLLLLHGFYLLPIIFVAALMSRNQTLVIMPHGSLDSFQEKHSLLIKRVFKTVFKFLIREKRLIFFCATEVERKQILERYPTTQVEVVGLGVELPYSLGNLEYGVKAVEPTHTLIYLGRIHKKKNIEALISSMKLLANSSYDLTLDIYGSGDSGYLEALENLAESEGVTGRIRFRGFVDGLEKYNALNRADLFVLPSHNENFAIAVAESILASTPVIVSKEVAMSDFVHEHGSGIVLRDSTPQSIANAIKEAYGDLHNLQKACLESREQLMWDKVFQNWLKAIRGIYS